MKEVIKNKNLPCTLNHQAAIISSKWTHNRCVLALTRHHKQWWISPELPRCSSQFTNARVTSRNNGPVSWRRGSKESLSTLIKKRLRGRRSFFHSAESLCAHVHNIAPGFPFERENSRRKRCFLFSPLHPFLQKKKKKKRSLHVKSLVLLWLISIPKKDWKYYTGSKATLVPVTDRDIYQDWKCNLRFMHNVQLQCSG